MGVLGIPAALGELLTPVAWAAAVIAVAVGVILLFMPR